MFPVYSDKLLCGTFSFVQMNYWSAPESWFKKDFSIYGCTHEMQAYTASDFPLRVEFMAAV